MARVDISKYTIIIGRIETSVNNYTILMARVETSVNIPFLWHEFDMGRVETSVKYTIPMGRVETSINK